MSWSHDLQLMRIENKEERSFYEIESAKSGWGIRTFDFTGLFKRKESILHFYRREAIDMKAYQKNMSRDKSEIYEVNLY